MTMEALKDFTMEEYASSSKEFMCEIYATSVITLTTMIPQDRCVLLESGK